MKKKVIIIGDGGHAVSCIDIIENSNNLKIIGIITKSKTPKKKFLKKYKIFLMQKNQNQAVQEVQKKKEQKATLLKKELLNLFYLQQQ